MVTDAKTVREYLDSLPEDRRKEVQKVRSVIRKHIPAGYKEGMQYNAISWYVPLARYPKTCNDQPLAVISLASQKDYISLYLLGAYGIPGETRRLEQGFRKAGKKLNMGKSCIRLRKVEDLPLDVIGEAVARVPVDRFIKVYEQSRRRRK